MRVIYSSPIGNLELVADDSALTEVRFLESLQCFSKSDNSEIEHPILKEVIEWFDQYFLGNVSAPFLKVRIDGTAFQKQVLKEVLAVPYGKIVTYGQLADKIGCRSAQAIGGALKRNKLLIVVPCHRVVSSEGHLTGYVAGVEKKEWLLANEKKGNRMYTFYEYPKCTTCKKAKAELKQLGLNFESVDIKLNPPKASTLKEWMKSGKFPLKKFFNTSGQSYRSLGLKDKIADLSIEAAAELLASDGMLIKRPILVQDNQVVQIGYRTSYGEL